MTEIPVWEFAMGEDSTCLEQARTVRVPHTWSIEDGTRSCRGKGWYRTRIELEPTENTRTFLRFRGAYRDTRVWVNGSFAGEHTGSGYTPFEIEITRFMEDLSVEITISIDNSPSEDAIPVGNSFDWPDDGGLLRPVEWYQTGPAKILDAWAEGMPVLTQTNMRNDSGAAFYHVHFDIDGDLTETKLSWALYAGAQTDPDFGKQKPVSEGLVEIFQSENDISGILTEQIRYWHFDSPQLYTIDMVLLHNGNCSDMRYVSFGVRQLVTYGQEWRLNGEPVRLPGMEWMPGSNPRYGLAETRKGMEEMLSRLRECNCILTRFHWQQDEDVLNYCDHHGLLVQEEVPLWGPEPADPEKQEQLWPLLRERLREMITAHRSHPCIIAWGVGNELSADSLPVQQLIQQAVEFVHEMDSSREVNYVSNTAWNNPSTDGTVYGDIMMVNDYIGTWHTGLDQMEAWKSLVQSNPGRIMIPSEFGLCEPVFSGGDAERARIFLEKMACYRTFPQIAGTIFFSLNDYRTHMGEAVQDGEHIRIHGATDLKGTPKPSFYTIKREYSPLIVRLTKSCLTILCRSDIPSYTVKGYTIRTADKIRQLPVLRPGHSFILLGNFTNQAIRICRPDGTAVLTL